MADAVTQSKIDAATDKAKQQTTERANAVETDIAANVADAVEADAPKAEPKLAAVKKAVEAPAKKTVTAKAPAKKIATKPAVKKALAGKKTAPKKIAAKKPAAKKVPAKKAAPAKSNPVIKLKDTIMATAKKNDFATSAKEMASTAQERVQSVYANAGEYAGEFGQFNKANVEAVVESGKIFFAGAQELAKDNVETGKTVVETFTADAKKMTSVKSPTELFQLQGELARRNFDAVVGYGSKRTEAWVKLYNDAFAPISNRVSVAAEKISKAA